MASVDGGNVEAKPELIYIGDPMCSWCWGIAPVIDRLSRRTDIDTRVVVGGLRPGPQAELFDDRMREFLLGHWEKVAAATGQPFNPRALNRQDWVYDTEVPAIAVTTMRAMAPEVTLDFFSSIQQAFYRDAIDITAAEEYEALIAGFDVDSDAFLEEIQTDEARSRAWEDFAEARELGAMGFPTVLLDVEGSLQVLSRGWASLDRFENQLEYWVEGRQPGSASEYVCWVDGSDC